MIKLAFTIRMGFRWIGACGCALLLALSVNGQTLRGSVETEDGQGLALVNVYIAALDLGTVTDEEGLYRIENVPLGTHDVRFTFVGFVTQTRTVRVGEGETLLEVVLRPGVVETEEVRVVAEHDASAALVISSLSVSVLDPQALEDLRGQTLGETLATLPGVTTLSTGPSIAKPVIRGLHSQRLVLLNAGVPQEGQQWGGEHAPEIDPFSPVRIDVVKGAAGVEYGVGAIGGVIRIEPRPLPETARMAGEVALNGFSNNRQGAGSLLLEGRSRAVSQLAWRVQGSFRKAGDTHAPDYTIGNSAFSEQNASLALEYHESRWGVDVYASRFATELGIYRGAHINNIADLMRAIERGEPRVDYDFGYSTGPPKQNIVHYLATVKTHYNTPSGDRFILSYGVQDNRRKEFDAHRGADAKAAFNLGLATHTLDLKLQHRPIGSFFGRLGVSGMNQANRNAASGFLIPNFRALTSGAFLHETMVRGRWTADLGVRYDYRWQRAWPYDRSAREFVATERTYQSMSGVLGMIYRWERPWSLALNIGTGWRPPGVNELYSNGVHHGTAQFEIGNPDLVPERSVDVNLTLRHEGPRTSLEVSAFQNHIDDFIYSFPQPEPTVTIRGVYPTFIYQQTEARLRGIDGSIRVQPLPWLELGVQGSWLHSYDLTQDAPLFGMPSNRLRTSAQIELPAIGALSHQHLELELTSVARQDRVPENVDYAPPPDGYQLVNLTYRTEWQVNGAEIRASLGVQNAFNTAYRDYLSRFRYFIDEPGRSVVFRLLVPLASFR